MSGLARKVSNGLVTSLGVVEVVSGCSMPCSYEARILLVIGHLAESADKVGEGLGHSEFGVNLAPASLPLADI